MVIYPWKTWGPTPTKKITRGCQSGAQAMLNQHFPTDSFCRFWWFNPIFSFVKPPHVLTFSAPFQKTQHPSLAEADMLTMCVRFSGKVDRWSRVEHPRWERIKEHMGRSRNRMDRSRKIPWKYDWFGGSPISGSHQYEAHMGRIKDGKSPKPHGGFTMGELSI